MKKTVVVTGATTSTGIAVAEKFASEGWDVVITSRDGEKAAKVASDIASRFGVWGAGYGLEVCNEPQMIAMFDELKAGGHLVTDIVLVAANLANGMPGMFDIAYEDWIRVIDTNIGWNFQFSRNAAKHMIEAGGGHIVAIGSVTGVKAIKGRTPYIASKGGLHALIRALAVDLAKYNIRANTIIAGGIKTERYLANPALKNSPHNMIPLHEKNVADGADIANAAFFLCSDASAFTTGSQLMVDGGALAQLCYEEEAVNPYAFKK